MKHHDPNLATPLYVKTDENAPWPADEGVFHLMTRDGLFIARNNEHFTSCVPVAKFPVSLASQASFLRIRYPKLSRRQYELIVGFFTRIADLYTAEAFVLLAWDRKACRYRLIVPKQTATVGCSSNGSNRYPIGVYYTIDPSLPVDWNVIGSVHSHVDEGASSSGVDVADEKHRAGLHIIIGRIHDPVPEVHVSAVVDGMRFRVAPERVIEGFRKRRIHVPREWIERLKIDLHKPKPYYYTGYRYDDSDRDWGRR
jgi:hypothetical protein